MYRNIILAIVLIFFVIGVITVISLILMRAVYPDKKSNIVIVCPFGKEDRDCAVIVSCIISILTVLGLLSRCSVAVVDKGMHPNEKENILYSFGRDPNVTVLGSDRIREIFDIPPDEVP